MPAVRLPQSIQEMNACARVIVNYAYPDLKVSPSRKLAKEYEEDRKLLVGWLGSIAAFGAIQHVDLVTQAELCLNSSSSQLQALRPSKVASLIARRVSWLGAA